jgi:hypothetical protein
MGTIRLHGKLMPSTIPHSASLAALEADLRSAKHRLEELEFRLADMSWALKLARASITKHFSTAHLGLDSWDAVDQQAWDVVRNALQGIALSPCDRVGHIGSPCVLCGREQHC